MTDATSKAGVFVLCDWPKSRAVPRPKAIEISAASTGSFRRWHEIAAFRVSTLTILRRFATAIAWPEPTSVLSQKLT